MLNCWLDCCFIFKWEGGTGVKLVPLSYAKLMQRLWILRRRGVYGGTTMQPIWGVACMIPNDQGGLVSCNRTDI